MIHNKTLLLIALLAFSFQVFAQKPFVHPDGKFVKVNGANLWIETEGKGDPLFLISGGPGGAHVGMHSFAPLKDVCTLVYIDNFGRGKSDTANSLTEYSLSRDVEDIEGIRQALGYDKINVLGHSYGGVVAQAYAVKYGDHLNHVILANSFYSGAMWQKNDDNSNHEIKTNYPEVWEALMKLREAGSLSASAEHQEVYGQVPYGFLYAYNPDKFLKGIDSKYPNKMNTRLYYQLVGEDGDFTVAGDVGAMDFTRDLKNFKMPVLILAGRYDRVSVPEFAVRYKQYCPQAKFVMFEKSGHNPQVEEPELEFSIIREFLR